MTHLNSVQYQQSQGFGFKPFFVIRDFFTLISSAWAEAKIMEQKSYKNSANW